MKVDLPLLSAGLEPCALLGWGLVVSAVRVQEVLSSRWTEHCTNFLWLQDIPTHPINYTRSTGRKNLKATRATTPGRYQRKAWPLLHPTLPPKGELGSGYRPTVCALQRWDRVLQRFVHSSQSGGWGDLQSQWETNELYWAYWVTESSSHWFPREP